MERADGTFISYSYDKNGNMTLLTTPVPADNSFTYNGVNRRSGFRTPLGSTTTYSYNQERQLTEITLPSAKRIVNSYTDGRLISTTTPEWTNSYTYACGDLPASITRGTETLGFTRDGSLLTGILQRGTLNRDLGLAYNNDFNLIAFTYAGATEGYAYDNDGLLTASGRFSITRNPDNGLPEQVSDTVFVLDRTFNGYGEVEGVGVNMSGMEVFGYDLSRDNSGRITAKTDTVNNVSANMVYTYDDMGRLLTVTRDSTLTEEYRYDNNGNRIYEMNSQLGITGRNLTYSVEDHIITSGYITYSFDYDDMLSGRTEGNATTEYVYSGTGELMSVTLPDSDIIEYVHDPMGRRIAKKVNGAVTEKYLWSDRITLLAVYDGADNLLQRFEYTDNRLPYAMTAGGATYYLAYDQVGSLRLVVDSSGNVVKQVDYDSFGNIISDSNEAFMVPFGFAGGLHDRDTGLVRFGYRDYMPEIGRWTAKDPILFEGGGTNLYGYVLNDPVNGVDPTGEFGIPGAIVGVVTGAYGGFLSGIQSGNIGAGVIGGIAGAAVGGVTGVVIPQFSGVLGGIIGGGVAGMLGGGAGAALSTYLDPCSTGKDISDAASRGMLYGGITGALGGAFGAGAASLGASGAAVDVASAMMTNSVGIGLGLIK